MEEERERLIELYEKGILTKEEAQACFLEFGETSESFVKETNASPLVFSLFHRLKSSKVKEVFSFDRMDSLAVAVTSGHLAIVKHSKEQIQVSITYDRRQAGDGKPEVALQAGQLVCAAPYPCHLVVALPEKNWWPILSISVGTARTRLDYLPFEDISICSDTDTKQQDIRITSLPVSSQHISVQVRQATVRLLMGKKQGLHCQLMSGSSVISLNKKMKKSPYTCEKKGPFPLYFCVETKKSAIGIKGVRDVTSIVQAKKK